MLNKTKLAITWAELILTALLVVGGIGIWSYVAEQVEIRLKPEEPVEEYLTDTEAVVLAKAELTAAQADLASLQEEIGKQRVSLEQLRAQMGSQQAAHAFLANIPAGDVFSPDLFKAYWEAELNAESVNKQIDALGSQIEGLIAQKARLTLDSQQLTEGSREALVAAEQITYTDDQLTASKEKMGSLQLDLVQQRALVSALEELHPGLANFSLSKQTSPYPSSELLGSYFEAVRQDKETETILTSLEGQVSAKQTAFIAATTALTAEQQRAHQAFVIAQNEFLDRKKAEIRQTSAVWILGYLVVTLFLYGLIALLRKSLPSVGTVFLLSAAALLILVAYQEFQIMGGGLVSLGIFILLLIVIAVVGRFAQKGRTG